MALPRIRTWKCPHFGRQLYSQRCTDCNSTDVVSMIGLAAIDPLANVELPATVSEFALGESPPIPGSSPDE
jgi:hypothetical protein